MQIDAHCWRILIWPTAKALWFNYNINIIGPGEQKFHVIFRFLERKLQGAKIPWEREFHTWYVRTKVPVTPEGYTSLV